MNILVLEDEQRAGEKLIDLIQALGAEINISWERSVKDGIAFLEANKSIDLIFSDIELLDGNVFEVYDKIKVECPIIFCTAYDKFYVNAFKTNGIAYLLKPYTKEQFQDAWGKYQLLFDTKKTVSLSHQLIEELQLLVGKEAKTYRKIFTVKKPKGVFLLKIENILYFQAKGDFVIAYDTHLKKHLLSRTLSSIEESINPNQFFRINRSEIIQMNFIEKYDGYFRNKLAITLQGLAEPVFTSTSRTPEFRKWIGDD